VGEHGETQREERSREGVYVNVYAAAMRRGMTKPAGVRNGRNCDENDRFQEIYNKIYKQNHVKIDNQSLFFADTEVMGSAEQEEIYPSLSTAIAHGRKTDKRQAGASLLLSGPSAVTNQTRRLVPCSVLERFYDLIAKFKMNMDDLFDVAC
jgi:hypothetical protein